MCRTPEVVDLLGALRMLRERVLELCDGIDDQAVDRPFVDSISARTIITDLMRQEIVWVDQYYLGREVPAPGASCPADEMAWPQVRAAYDQRGRATEALLTAGQDLSHAAAGATGRARDIASPTLRGVLLRILAERAGAAHQMQLARIAILP